uniref:Ig-like domain-containing protein n=1 Tax=Mola mola TaxID=94237 RepID=A0A3Q3WVC5_MOLML
DFWPMSDFINPADIRQEETLVIWYSGNHIYYNYDTFGHRVQFVSLHPASGNASISISDLKMTDTNTYKCKVRKLPGIESRIIQLNVMERPTKTECYAEGVVELDRKIAFRCRCTEGSPPIWYAWSMDGTGKRLPCDAYVDSTQGDLFLTITKEVAPGTLVCTAHNPLGMTTCLVTLSLNSASVVTTAAAAGTVFVVLIVITNIIMFCRKRRRTEDSGNEILEDELPPYPAFRKESTGCIFKDCPVCNVNVEFSRCECGSHSNWPLDCIGEVFVLLRLMSGWPSGVQVDWQQELIGGELTQTERKRQTGNQLKTQERGKTADT